MKVTRKSRKSHARFFGIISQSREISATLVATGSQTLQLFFWMIAITWNLLSLFLNFLSDTFWKDTMRFHGYPWISKIMIDAHVCQSMFKSYFKCTTVWLPWSKNSDKNLDSSRISWKTLKNKHLSTCLK